MWGGVWRQARQAPSSSPFSTAWPSAPSSTTTASSASSAPKTGPAGSAIQPEAGRKAANDRVRAERVARSERKRRADFRVDRTLQFVNGRPARETRTGLHRSENRLARAAGVSARGESAAIPVHHPRRRLWRSARHTRHRLQRVASGARARHVGRHLFRGRRRRAQGARLVRSVCYDVLQVDIRLSKPFAVPMRAGYIGLDRSSGWKNLK